MLLAIAFVGADKIPVSVKQNKTNSNFQMLKFSILKVKKKKQRILQVKEENSFTNTTDTEKLTSNLTFRWRREATEIHSSPIVRQEAFEPEK